MGRAWLRKGGEGEEGEDEEAWRMWGVMRMRMKTMMGGGVDDYEEVRRREGGR